MKNKPANKKIDIAHPHHRSTTVVGSIVDVDESGMPLVSFAQNPFVEPQPALSTLDESQLSKIQSLPIEVTLEFDNGDVTKPIVTGLITPFTLPDLKQSSSSVVPDAEATVDGKKIVFDARDEIVLNCGKSSIKLFRDGRIIIKGDSVTSRSRYTNKIKGGSVSIN